MLCSRENLFVHSNSYMIYVYWQLNSVSEFFFYAQGDCMNLKVILEPSEEGGFTVFVPSLPGCISEGDTKKEALANIKEAIELYLEPVDDDLACAPGSEVLDMAI